MSWFNVIAALVVWVGGMVLVWMFVHRSTGERDRWDRVDAQARFRAESEAERIANPDNQPLSPCACGDKTLPEGVGVMHVIHDERTETHARYGCRKVMA